MASRTTAHAELHPTVLGPGAAAADSPTLGITERDVDGVQILVASGELDLGAAAELCARVDSARAAGCRRMLLDLTGLESCDSSGVRALIGAADEVRASAGEVVVVPPPAGAVARLFAPTGVDRRLPLGSSLADGLAALGAREAAGR